MKARLSRPTGFSNPSHYISDVEVVGYCFGMHPDAKRYNREGQYVLAICIGDDGRFVSVPIAWLHRLTEAEAE